MANDLKRRLSALESKAGDLPSALAPDEIDRAVMQYDAARCGHDDHTPPSSAFRTMLGAMRPSLARLFLHAQPADLVL